MKWGSLTAPAWRPILSSRLVTAFGQTGCRWLSATPVRVLHITRLVVFSVNTVGRSRLHPASSIGNRASSRHLMQLFSPWKAATLSCIHDVQACLGWSLNSASRVQAHAQELVGCAAGGVHSHIPPFAILRRSESRLRNPGNMRTGTAQAGEQELRRGAAYPWWDP